MRLLLLLLCLAGPLSAAPAWAQAAEASAPLTVEVALVRATRGAPGVDRALASMERALTALPYQRFEALGTGGWTTKAGGKGAADLPQQVRVVATVISITDQGATVSVSVTRGGQQVSSTTFERPWGLAHVLGVGKDGDAALLVPVRVTR